MKYVVYRENDSSDYEIISPPNDKEGSKVIMKIDKSLSYNQVCEIAAAPELAKTCYMVYESMLFPTKYKMAEIAKSIKETLVKANRIDYLTKSS